MVYKHLIFYILFFAFSSEHSFTQSKLNSTTLPNNFAEESFNHIVEISNFGVHTAGTVEEKQVSEYILKQLVNLGIETHIEPFEFESFDIIKTDLRLNHKRIEAKQICLNPYIVNTQFQDNFILLNSDNTTDLNIKDKIVVACFPLTNSKYFQLFFKSPTMIFVISALDFQKISMQNSREVKCKIIGEIKKHTSQNVVGTIPGKQNNSQEIILTAHYDSYPGSVGADDNASGVGILIELAKFYKQTPINTNLKFIAFGGEEKGLLGSRAYLNKHSEELTNCKLLFNMDQVGGKHIFIETTGGVHGISQMKGKTQIPDFLRNKSLEGIETNWRLLTPDVLLLFSISNKPEWLVNIIKESTNELSVPVAYAGNTGSDQMTFAQAGIVASAIGTSGKEVHSPKDIPSQVHKKSLLNCGNIVNKIVLKTDEK